MPSKQWLHHIVTTATIFNSKGQVLLIKRFSKWDVPGGGLETNDYIAKTPTHIGETYYWYNTLHRSVRREVLEQTGLLIGEPWLVCDLTYIRSDGVPALVVSYAANVIERAPGFSSIVTLDSKAVDYAWVTLEEAKQYNLIDNVYYELELAFASWNDRKRAIEEVKT